MHVGYCNAMNCSELKRAYSSAAAVDFAGFLSGKSLDEKLFLHRRSAPETIMQFAKKILFLTYLFTVATPFLLSKLRALLLWESERENCHIKGFPSCGGTNLSQKVSISTSGRCSIN